MGLIRISGSFTPPLWPPGRRYGRARSAAMSHSKAGAAGGNGGWPLRIPSSCQYPLDPGVGERLQLGQDPGPFGRRDEAVQHGLALG